MTELNLLSILELSKNHATLEFVFNFFKYQVVISIGKGTFVDKLVKNSLVYGKNYTVFVNPEIKSLLSKSKGDFKYPPYFFTFSSSELPSYPINRRKGLY